MKIQVTNDKRKVSIRNILSYGRGFKEELVFIETAQLHRINKIRPIGIIFPVIVFMLFYVIYGVDDIIVMLKERECFINPYSINLILILGVVLAIPVNWLIQSLMFYLFNPHSFNALCVRINKANMSIKLDCSEPLRLWKFRIVFHTAHIISAYLPLVIGLVTKDIVLSLASSVAAIIFFDEIYILWRLRIFHKRTICAYELEEI